MASQRPTTLGELQRSGWQPRTVKREMRENLIARLESGQEGFPGIVGFDQTVIPEIQNAILSGHDFILLGLRGQAKTRILRSLSALLDEALPAVEGCEINDDPTRPRCAACIRRWAEEGDSLPVRWIPSAERYREKLATPDVTISDLIGDIDPIKAATRRLDLADPEVIHYGIIPRTNRGIFAINELPDLQGRIQVGLLNILEEGDVQIRGFPVRLPLDVCMVFSANPEDYTNRGNIITPLRDRIASQIVTHYPRSIDDAKAITRQEAWIDRDGRVKVTVPEYLSTVVEEVAFQARKSDFVDQASGVSARMTISLMENVVSSAERRAFRLGETNAVARPSDLAAAVPAISGKIELVYDGEREGVQVVSAMLIGKALKAVFDSHFPDAYGEPTSGESENGYAGVLRWFQGGNTVDISPELSTADLLERLRAIPDLERLARRYLEPGDGEALAAAMEFVLEGLHQSSLVAKEELVGRRVYRDMMAEMAESLGE
jgi:magnesium chelatase subunit I